MFPLEQGAFEMVLIGVFALIVVGPKDLPVLMRRVGQAMATMRGLAAEFRASFDEMARQSELDELRKEVEALRTTASAPLGSLHADLQSEVAALNEAYRSPPYGSPSPPSGSLSGTLPEVDLVPDLVPDLVHEPRGFAFPPRPLAYEPPVFETPLAEPGVAEPGVAAVEPALAELSPPAKPKPPRKPRARKAAAPSAETLATEALSPEADA